MLGNKIDVRMAYKVLLVGSPGSGKTWVMKGIIKQLKCLKRQKIGLFSWHTNDDVMVLGKYDGSMYEGSDRLSMGIMKDIDLFLGYASDKNVICEGDRFMNNTYISKVRPIIIKILDDGAGGRLKRGSTQTTRQLKSMNTRVSNVSATYEVKDSNEALELINKIIENEAKGKKLV